MEEILHQLIWKISHYLQGFIHPRWCRISSINSFTPLFPLKNISTTAPEVLVPSQQRLHRSPNVLTHLESQTAPIGGKKNPLETIPFLSPWLVSVCVCVFLYFPPYFWGWWIIPPLPQGTFCISWDRLTYIVSCKKPSSDLSSPEQKCQQVTFCSGKKPPALSGLCMRCKHTNIQSYQLVVPRWTSFEPRKKPGLDMKHESYWLVKNGILIMVYEIIPIPSYCNPLHNPTNRGFEHCSNVWK